MEMELLIGQKLFSFVSKTRLNWMAGALRETFSSRFILFFLCIIFVLQSSMVWAEIVRVPVNIRYPFLRQLFLLTVFDGPGHTAEILMDPAGCSKVILSEPGLTGHGNAMRLFAKARAITGMPSEDGCIFLTEWAGEIEVLARPVVLYEQSTVIGFKVEGFNLYQKGEPLTSGIIWESFRECTPSVLGHFHVDFGPSMDELKALLPAVLPRHSAAQVRKLIASLQMTGVRADPESLNLELSMEVEKLPPAGPLAEPLLTAEEMKQWEKQWESWDSFLTFVIKWAAAETALAPVRAALLEILLDARYEFRSALSSNTRYDKDPVRRLFVRSWKRLSPLLQEICANEQGQAPLTVIAFLTAGDALQTLDHLGPALGLEISADGLRRLARMLSEEPGIDPLRYKDEVDPELQGLFGIDTIEEEPSDSEPLKFNSLFIRPAFAGTSPRQAWERLNKWVPTRAELDQYLPLVRKMLVYNADAMLKGVNVGSQAATVYQKLVLAAAWQESCWRQYIIEKRKLVPLRSDCGDIGLMQINERVWRGFYSINKLKWDINYNARAGCEILMKYLADYALPKGEHKQGDVHYLARAVYSAYNGGPSQISRYRNPKAPALHKKIDTAFWKKYQAVREGKEYNVAECLGGTQVAAPAEGAKHDKKTITGKTPALQAGSNPKPSGPPALKQERWIIAQNPKHFTLQVVAHNSEQSTKEFILKQRHPERFAYYRLKRNGTLYPVIYGDFATLADAEKAAPHLGFDKPWIRNFGTLQKIIKGR